MLELSRFCWGEGRSVETNKSLPWNFNGIFLNFSDAIWKLMTIRLQTLPPFIFVFNFTDSGLYLKSLETKMDKSWFRFIRHVEKRRENPNSVMKKKEKKILWWMEILILWIEVHPELIVQTEIGSPLSWTTEGPLWEINPETEN